MVPRDIHSATGHTGGASLVKGTAGAVGVAGAGSAEAGQNGIMGTGVTWKDVGNTIVDFLVPGGVSGVGEGSDLVPRSSNTQYFNNSLNPGGAGGQSIKGVSPGPNG